jgi:hypothetical protein
VKIYERLSAANPARFEPDLAASLMARAMASERSGDLALACACASSALPIWTRLAEASPAAHLGRLLQVLRDCSRIFAAGGMEDEAKEAAEELAGLEKLIQEAQAQASTDAGPPAQD